MGEIAYAEITLTDGEIPSLKRKRGQINKRMFDGWGLNSVSKYRRKVKQGPETVKKSSAFGYSIFSCMFIISNVFHVFRNFGFGRFLLKHKQTNK